MRAALASVFAVVVATGSFGCADGSVYPPPCAPGWVASDQQVCRPEDCVRACDGKRCGDPDGCGGFCIHLHGCAAPMRCESGSSQCVCDSGSCRGCCGADDVCHLDSETNDQYCGVSHGSCTPCPGETQCIRGKCQ